MTHKTTIDLSFEVSKCKFPPSRISCVCLKLYVYMCECVCGGGVKSRLIYTNKGWVMEIFARLLEPCYLVLRKYWMCHFIFLFLKKRSIDLLKGYMLKYITEAGAEEQNWVFLISSFLRNEKNVTSLGREMSSSLTTLEKKISGQ